MTSEFKFAHAFLAEAGSGKLRHEEQLLRGELERRGIPVTLYTAKRMQRRQIPLTLETFIAGDMDAMHSAMRQLNINIPTPNDYPDSLLPFAHRRIWRSTLGAVEHEVLEGNGEPVFVKPAERRKGFTGRVFTSVDDFRGIGNVSRRQEVWCSEVVSWLAEYRVYVIGTEVLSVDLYAGNDDVLLDSGTLDGALAAFRKTGEAPAAYGIDFGVLASGETAVVEANDGYALGAYKISARDYTELLFMRWRELLAGASGRG